MARIYPFRALRYNPAMVKLEDVVTQPYDKISPSMQQSYYRKSPYNLVRIILGLPELFDGEGTSDVYQRAARDFKNWRATGILQQEKNPCIFAYSQRFAIPGSNGTMAERHGFIALGELYDYSQQVVFRHEQTLAKPKSDRLNLLRATRAHFGQIFMLYSDPAQTAESILLAANTQPEIEIMDEFGVSHRLSKVSDPNTINILLTAMEDKKLIIADGHHRYETALGYAKEHEHKRLASSERNSYILPQPAYPEAATMMTFVNMDSEGLVILPTHRAVHSLAGFRLSELMANAAKYFEIAPATGNTRELQSELVRAGAGSMAAVSAEGSYLLRAKPEAVSEALKNIPERQRKLDVVLLHTLVLEKLLGISPEAIRDEENVRYLRDGSEAVEQAMRGEANIAFLMNPVTLNQLREVAFAGDVMPQKSTDFYPKLLSGLAVYALD